MKGNASKSLVNGGDFYDKSIELSLSALAVRQGQPEEQRSASPRSVLLSPSPSPSLGAKPNPADKKQAPLPSRSPSIGSMSMGEEEASVSDQESDEEKSTVIYKDFLEFRALTSRAMQQILAGFDALKAQNADLEKKSKQLAKKVHSLEASLKEKKPEVPPLSPPKTNDAPATSPLTPALSSRKKANSLDIPSPMKPAVSVRSQSAPRPGSPEAGNNNTWASRHPSKKEAPLSAKSFSIDFDIFEVTVNCKSFKVVIQKESATPESVTQQLEQHKIKISNTPWEGNILVKEFKSEEKPLIEKLFKDMAKLSFSENSQASTPRITHNSGNQSISPRH